MRTVPQYESNRRIGQQSHPKAKEGVSLLCYSVAPAFAPPNSSCSRLSGFGSRMFANDAKWDSVTKHRIPSWRSFHNSDQPTDSPRRRPRKAVTPSSGPLQYSAAGTSQQRNSWAPLYFFSSAAAVEFCTKITPRCVLLACASGLAWASFIVWLLGPAVVSPTGTSSDLPPDHSQLGLVERGGGGPFPTHNKDGLPLPGWTPLGHHSRFLGREVFPKLFKHWQEEGEVAINTMDVGPLTVDNQVLPKTDILLAILSGDDEVRARLEEENGYSSMMDCGEASCVHCIEF